MWHCQGSYIFSLYTPDAAAQGNDLDYSGEVGKEKIYLSHDPFAIIKVGKDRHNLSNPETSGALSQAKPIPFPDTRLCAEGARKGDKFKEGRDILLPKEQNITALFAGAGNWAGSVDCEALICAFRFEFDWQTRKDWVYSSTMVTKLRIHNFCLAVQPILGQASDSPTLMDQRADRTTKAPLSLRREREFSRD
jgi:hypothetical protein